MYSIYPLPFKSITLIMDSSREELMFPFAFKASLSSSLDITPSLFESISLNTWIRACFYSFVNNWEAMKVCTTACSLFLNLKPWILFIADFFPDPLLLINCWSISLKYWWLKIYLADGLSSTFFLNINFITYLHSGLIFSHTDPSKHAWALSISLNISWSFYPTNGIFPHKNW